MNNAAGGIVTNDAIEEVRIEVTSNGELALSMMVHRDGTLGRQGSGAVPQTQPAVLGMTDGRYFCELLRLVDEVVFRHAGAYDYANKAGVLVEYTLVFIAAAGALGDQDRPHVGFRIALGTAKDNVHPIVKYVDTFVCTAVRITNPWYAAAVAGKRGSECPGGI